jgi:pimeloyl-ACP methyl ester carboxylesterase
MKVYMIPGLAADKRVFRHIRLPEGYEEVCMDWIPPQPGESLKGYAWRMSEQINHEEPFVLAGLSFGGMLAVEIAKKILPHRLILIASISHHGQLPSYYRRAWQIGLQHLVTPAMIKNGVFLKRLLTAESPEDKAIIKQMARDMDPAFIKWAMEAIVRWETDDTLPELIHIHGTADYILPYKLTSPSISIPKGGHLMIFDRAGEINKVLGEYLRHDT